MAYAGWQGVYVNDIGDRSEAVAARTYDYARYMNTQTVPEIVRAATAYRNAISSAANAHELMRKGGFDLTSSGPGDSSRTKTGYGNSGHWGRTPPMRSV